MNKTERKNTNSYRHIVIRLVMGYTDGEKNEGEKAMEKEMDYREGIHRVVDKITDRKILKMIYQLVNRMYAMH